jgi:hypothetical protein
MVYSLSLKVRLINEVAHYTRIRICKREFGGMKMKASTMGGATIRSRFYGVMGVPYDRRIKTERMSSMDSKLVRSPGDWD